MRGLGHSRPFFFEAYCLLLTAYCLLLTAYCLLLTGLLNRNTVQFSGFHVGEPLRRLAFPWLLNRSAVCLGLGETELREN